VQCPQEEQFSEVRAFGNPTASERASRIQLRAGVNPKVHRAPPRFRLSWSFLIVLGLLVAASPPLVSWWSTGTTHPAASPKAAFGTHSPGASPTSAVPNEIQQRDSVERETSWQSAFAESSQTVLSELDRLLGQTGNDTDELPRSQIQEWTRADPLAASAWVAGLEDPARRAELLEQVSIAWANLDPIAAAQWVSGLPEDQAKHTSTLAIANEAARSDPLTALRLIRELPSTLERDQALTHAVSQWASSDAVSALRWSSEIADPLLQERLFAEIAVAAAGDSPTAAAELASSLMHAGEPQASAVISIVQRWAQQAPGAAAEWILRFPETSLRSVALENLTTVWAARDAAALEAWAASLPSGSVRDSVEQIYARLRWPR
jgi:hypothetical protein